MNGPYFGPCTTIRQYRDRDQDLQDRDDEDTEAARQEADSFSFGPRHKFTNTRLETAMDAEHIVQSLMFAIYENRNVAFEYYKFPKDSYGIERDNARTDLLAADGKLRDQIRSALIAVQEEH